eukprot:983755-Amphidinium_carterae.1
MLPWGTHPLRRGLIEYLGHLFPHHVKHKGPEHLKLWFCNVTSWQTKQDLILSTLSDVIILAEHHLEKQHVEQAVRAAR